MVPVECIMRCPPLQEPKDATFDEISKTLFRIVQQYEVCARRHEDCANALELPP